MNSYSDVSLTKKRLFDWYQKNQRDLPWRHTKDPYKVWISEIILQQTRIDQGLSYYERFIADFPDVFALATSPLNNVLKRWQGLGYYSRARNLHETAQVIVTSYDGQFPADYDKLLQLKGIGSYTAAAIASFCFGLPHAVLDGNVFRVLSRLFLVDTPIYSTGGKKQFSALAEMLLDRDQPDLFNQAIMDFGALQCTPSNPDCVSCPLADSCLAYKGGCVAEVPVRKSASDRLNRFFYYLVCYDHQRIWLRERTEKDIWQHLWEFPLVETKEETPLERLVEMTGVSGWIGSAPILHTPVRIRHILSHQVIHATFLPITVVGSSDLTDHFVEVPLDQLDQMPISRLTELFLLKYAFH